MSPRQLIAILPLLGAAAGADRGPHGRATFQNAEVNALGYNLCLMHKQQ